MLEFAVPGKWHQTVWYIQVLAVYKRVADSCDGMWMVTWIDIGITNSA